jgi:hypothetical protein
VFVFVFVLSDVEVVVTSEIEFTVEIVSDDCPNAAPDARRAKTASNLFIVPSECYHNETISEYMI